MSEAALPVAPNPNRLFALDFLKALSITAVVSYHSVFLPDAVYADSAMALEILFAPLRFCVPVLLTLSFLLMERGFGRSVDVPKGALIKKRLIRLLIPTGFWFGLATGLKLLTGNSISELAVSMLNGTVFYGAYFLLLLIQFLPLFIWFRKWFQDWRIVLLTVLLQGIIFVGIGQLLSASPASSAIALLRALNRPFVIYWFAYLALGVYLWHHWNDLVRLSKQISSWLKVSMIGVCCFSFAYEYYHLLTITKGAFPPFDYAIISCLLSVPILFLSCADIQEKQFPPLVRASISLLSKYSLGIFCVNGILSQVLLSISTRFIQASTLNLISILTIKILGWLFLMVVSIGVSMAMDRLRMGAFVR
jgi:Acyltransferase family